MDSNLFLRGLILGFSIAAPVGPIGILCIRRTLASGLATGFVSGLGAASADALYGSITALGLTAISSFLVSQQMWLRLAGGLALIILGIRTFRSHPAQEAARSTSSSLPGAYLSTLLLTLSNPMTIIAFVAVFAGLGVGADQSALAGAGIVVFGVFTGSALWWFLLSSATSLLRSQIDALKLVWINRISGIIIAAFGVLAALSI
jgi:threonine/homoserine/homoserine lactone efflux protein